ncbi:MAG: hypothetical protein KF763_17840 [Cyclobacteriaceae bacterium]|nr:hypothetical protein [Cyclobacteriaceae bacterium]
MSTIKEIGLEELNSSELKSVNGGSFAYDIGRAIRYLAFHGPGTGPAQWAAWEIHEAGLEAINKL